MKICSLKKIMMFSVVAAVAKLSALEPNPNAEGFKGLSTEEQRIIMSSLGMNCAPQLGLLTASYYHSEKPMDWAVDYQTNAVLFLKDNVILATMVVPVNTRPYEGSKFIDYNGNEYNVDKWTVFAVGSGKTDSDKIHLYMGKLNHSVTGIAPYTWYDKKIDNVLAMIGSMNKTKDVRQAGVLNLKQTEEKGDRIYFEKKDSAFAYDANLSPVARDGRLINDTGAPVFTNGQGSAAQQLIALAAWGLGENNSIQQFIGLEMLNNSWTTERLKEIGAE